MFGFQAKFVSNEEREKQRGGRGGFGPLLAAVVLYCRSGVYLCKSLWKYVTGTSQRSKK